MVACNCMGGPNCCMRRSNQIAPNNTQQPYRCPVCDGAGVVHATLYGGVELGTASTEPCRSCTGTGIVWLQQPPQINVPSVWVDPFDTDATYTTTLRFSTQEGEGAG